MPLQEDHDEDDSEQQAGKSWTEYHAEGMLLKF
jgi:hypothetical protein